MKKNLHIRIVAAMLFLTGIIAGSGCDALIYEDMLNCPPQGGLSEILHQNTL